MEMVFITLNSKMPYGITLKLIDGTTPSLFLIDEEGYELFGKDFSYYSTPFTCLELLAYAYNESTIVIKYIDNINRDRYVESFESQYLNNNGNRVISFKGITESAFNDIVKDCRLIELDYAKYDLYKRYRLLSFIGFIMSIFCCLRLLFAKKNGYNNY